MLLSEISSMQVLTIMNIAGVIFSFEFVVLLLSLLFKRFKDKTFFKNIDENLAYKLSEISSVFFSGISVVGLYFLYNHYFENLDSILSSLLILGGLILCNIIIKIINIVTKYKSKFSILFSNIILKGIDNTFLFIVITETTAILASLIPIVDITRYFGAGLKRTTLINFPFFISIVYLLLSNVGLILEYFTNKFERQVRQYVNEFFDLFCFILVSFWIIFAFSLSYNIFIILMIGILGTYLITKFATYLNINKLGDKRKIPVNLRYLYPISNIVSSTFWAGLLMVAIIFISLNFGNFYGLAVVCLSMIGNRFLKYTTSSIYNNSDSYRYVAKSLNNIVLFYIFFETLEFVARRQLDINIFSTNVIIGLFLSIVLVIFNLLKIFNLTKYMELNRKSVYLFFRSSLYIFLFCVCLYFVFPYINYEVLASFVLGLIIMTSLVSLIGINAIDVIYSNQSLDMDVNNIIRNNVIPLTNQITTLLIIITILLLPIINIGG